MLRPEPGLASTLAAVRACGLQAAACPLFAIEPVAWDVPPDASFDALLIGSANAVRHGGMALRRLAHLPVIAVGEASARVAREAGLTVSRAGTGGLQAMLDTLARESQPMRLLRLAGEAHVPLALPAGMAMTEAIVYRAAPLPIDAATADRLRGGGVALLHSGEAARRFASECDRLGIPRARLALAILAPRIAALAGSGWGEVGIAEGMSAGELLELAKEMCQKP